MSERKLASIRTISEIRPIEGADNIVCAVVDGWELVTQKSNNFKEGDLVVYFEIDSVLPEREEFEFLRDRCYVSAERSVNGAGFRLKTIKLRGQVSQGLIIPIDDVMKRSVHPFNFQPIWSIGEIGIFNEHIQDTVSKEGAFDLTDLLGVVKFERPLPTQLAGVARGNFPSFIPKTDEERIQNRFKHLMNKWINHRWEVTMKLDGSSFTAYYRSHPDIEGGQFGVCSRNLDLTETEGNSFWQVARDLDLETKMKGLGRNLAIQGELCGPGVQGNREDLSTLHMFVFNIFDIDKQEYLLPAVRRNICERLGLNHVPIITENLRLDPTITVRDILDMADGPSLNAKLREGIVFKSWNDPSISFKAISNKWLLKTGD